MTANNTPSIMRNEANIDNTATAGKMNKTLILTLAAVFALTPFTIDSTYLRCQRWQKQWGLISP